MGEGNRRTGNVRTAFEVELQSETRDHTASRNSWAEIYRETTSLRKNTVLLGQSVEADDGLVWRVKWAQRGAGTFGLLLIICYISGQSIATAVCAGPLFIFLGILYYKNVSLVIAKRLLREMNVVIVLVLALSNWSIDIARPAHSASVILGFVYALCVCAFVFLDTIKVKSRVFGILAGIIFVSANIYNMYILVFRGNDQGVVLLKYTIQENEYTFMKRSTKLTIFIQIMLFSMDGIYTLFIDRRQELMIFATGHIYREAGTAQKTETDNSLKWRINWSQRGAGVSALVTLICWVAGQYIATIVFAALASLFFGTLYYKNVSFVIAKRLLRETNVVIMFVLSLCNWVLNTARPRVSLDPIFGLLYLLLVSIFLFLDAVKEKSRVFVIAVGIIFILMNIYNIFDRIFGDADYGIVLLKYTIQGNEYTFMKRSIKRSIFLQVMLFSTNGIYTLFKDRKQELMIFATGKIYRETGTTSKEVEQESFVRRIKSENITPLSSI